LRYRTRLPHRTRARTLATAAQQLGAALALLGPCERVVAVEPVRLLLTEPEKPFRNPVTMH
jgi:hypothetical protein